MNDELLKMLGTLTVSIGGVWVALIDGQIKEWEERRKAERRNKHLHYL